MAFLSHLFAQNRAWAAEMTRHDPEFFEQWWPPNQTLQQTATAILVSRNPLSLGAAAAAELKRWPKRIHLVLEG